MPIKLNLHDNTSIVTNTHSNVSIIPCTPIHDNDSVINTVPGTDTIADKRLELLIAEEVKNRIAADAYLEEQIQAIVSVEGARYLLIDEKDNGTIDISILDGEEQVLDTKTITITKKLVKSVHLDWLNSKIVFTHYDNSILRCDISDMTQAVADEAARAKAAEASLRSDLSQEIQDRIDDVNAEETRAITAETALQSAIESEESSRISADSTLQAHIDNEEEARIAADSSLNTKIEAEISRATGREGELATAIANEGTQRQNADNQLQADIIAETTRATGAEGDLQTAINTEASTRASEDSALNTKIEAETTRATTAETALTTRIDNLDLSTVGETGSYIKTVSQDNGQLSATKQAFDTTLESGASDDNAPTTKAVKDYVDTSGGKIDTITIHGSEALPIVNKNVDLPIYETTTTGSESITVNQDTLNVVTRNTTQNIAGAKTFTNTIGSNVPSGNNILSTNTNWTINKDSNGKINIGQPNNDIRFYDNNIRVSTPTLRPQTDNTTSLGNSDNRFKELYLSGKAQLGPTWNIIGDETYLHFKSNDNLIYTMTSSAFFPRVSGKDLGANQTGLFWRHLYLTGNLSDGTNSITVAHIEDNQNKVTSDVGISASSTDEEYPSAKAVVDYVDTYGGKIDSISLDSTPLTIDANKNVDIPVSLTTTAGSEAVNVNSDSLNVVTRDTKQTISGEKTFTTAPIAKEMRFYSGDLTNPSGYYLSVANDNGYNSKIRMNGKGIMFTSGNIMPTTPVTGSNIESLGAPGYLWNNLHLLNNLIDNDGNAIKISQLANNSFFGASAYDATSTYAVGDKVLYQNKLYKCNTAIETAEDWTAAHWTEVTIGDYVDLMSNQTITGIKTIHSRLRFTDETNTQNITWEQYQNQYGDLAFRKEGTTKFALGTNDARFYSAHLLPSTGNTTYSIGSSDSLWKDLYLSGKANIGKISIEENSNGLSGKISFNNSVSFYASPSAINSLHIYPIAGDTYSLGLSNSRYKDLYLSGDVNFGDGAIINKDSSNRINLNYSNDAKVKVGSAETTFKGRLGADADNTYDIGRSSVRWKDLYLAGKINPNSNGYGLTFPDTSTLTADSQFVDTVSEQTISGIKTFSNGLKTEKIDSPSSELVLRTGNATRFVIANGAIKTRLVIRPENGYESVDLGTSSYLFRDLYLSRNLSDGTHTFTLPSATGTLALVSEVNTVDDKLDVNVHVEGNSDEITYSGDTVTKTSPYKNLKTGVTGSRSEVIHLANSTTAGMMSPADYNAIRNNTSRIENLEGQTKRLLYSDSTNPSQQDIQDFVDDYLESLGISDPQPEDYAGIAVVVADTYHIWHYYNDSGVGWKDDGADTVNIFTNSMAGIIQGKQADGFVYAENDGTGSVYGWSALKTRVSNLETDDESLTQRVTTLENTKVDKDVDNLTYYTKTADLPVLELQEETTSATGRLQYIKDFTYTSASVSGTDTFVKSIDGGSGSFTPTTKHLNAVYTAGTAVLSGTTKYLHFSAGSVPTKKSQSFIDGFSTNASMDFDTGSSSDAPYVQSISNTAASGTPTTRYLHKTTTTVMTGITSGSVNVAKSTHTHSVTAAGTVDLGSNGTSAGGVEYVESVSKDGYTPAGTVTLNANNFTTTAAATSITSDGTTDVVTGISAGSMIGTRSTSGSGTTARRTLSVSYTSASASGSTNVWKKTKISSTTDAFTGISSTKPTFAGSLSTAVVTSATTKYFHPTFTGTAVTSLTPSATESVLNSVSVNGTADAITGLSANTTSASGDITYLQAYSVSGGTTTATTKYMKFTAPVLSSTNIDIIDSVGTAPSLTINTTASGGEAIITGLSAGSVGGSVGLTNTESTGITYVESATHTHTAATITATASAVTGISAGSVNKTIRYMELENTNVAS